MLDLCAAPGTKTAQLAAALPHARLTAVDVDEARLDGMRGNLDAPRGRRGGRGGRRRLELPAAYEAAFDAVLLDAPCSGLGTLASRADLRWRRREADVARLAQLQRRLIRRAAACVRPGGILTYAVCTLPRVETVDVVDTSSRRAAGPSTTSGEGWPALRTRPPAAACSRCRRPTAPPVSSSPGFVARAGEECRRGSGTGAATSPGGTHHDRSAARDPHRPVHPVGRLRRARRDVETVINAGARIIHVDVMDGHFVPNITLGPMIVSALQPLVHGAGALLDVHLMIEHPERYVEPFTAAGADFIVVHQEACVHLHRVLGLIRESGAAAGVALNPATPVETLAEVRYHCDLVVIMSVNPGFGGQSFIRTSLDKIAHARAYLPDSVAIEVDGGVTSLNAGQLVAAGANLLVAGSSVFGRRARGCRAAKAPTSRAVRRAGARLAGEAV